MNIDISKITIDLNSQGGYDALIYEPGGTVTKIDGQAAPLHLALTALAAQLAPTGVKELEGVTPPEEGTPLIATTVATSIIHRGTVTTAAACHPGSPPKHHVTTIGARPKLAIALAADLPEVVEDAAFQLHLNTRVSTVAIVL